eukprot:jgi/Mesvir1/22100/Mv08901-RA.1
MQEELGRDRDGSTVWSAVYLPQGNMVMIKIVEGLTAAMAMHKWESAGLSLPLVSFTTGSQLWVVFRFLNGGPCSSILSSCFPKGLDEPLIASLGRGVLRVLKALHAEGYTHGDVGAASIYLEAYPPDPSSCKPSSSKPSSSKASSSMASTSAVSAVATGGMRVLGTTFNALTGTRTFLPGSKPWLSTSTPR